MLAPLNLVFVPNYASHELDEQRKGKWEKTKMVQQQDKLEQYFPAKL